MTSATITLRAIAAAISLALTACGGRQPQPPLAPPIATLQDLMAAEVDASADRIWASVGTIITANGTVDRQPRSAAEWKAVRADAIILVEATSLLVTPGRRVAASGRQTEDAEIPGIETAQHIQAAIDADPARFAAAAAVLRSAAIDALRAIDAKDPAALVTAGGNMDAACEACHLIYWYPHSPRPP